MLSTDQILAYAHKLANDLRSEMHWEDDQYGSRWAALTEDRIPGIEAKAAAAIEFLRTYAGEDSSWVAQARGVYERGVGDSSIEPSARAVSNMLDEWARQVKAGILEIAGWRAW